MKNIQIVLLTALCIVLGHAFAQPSTTSSGQNLMDVLVGKWQIVRINDGNKNTQVSSHPEAMQNIEFTREAKFIVKNSSIKSDSGLFRTNEVHSIIYLESINRTGTTTEWKVDLKNNMLTLSQKETPKIKGLRYVYIRQSSVEHPVNKENDRR